MPVLLSRFSPVSLTAGDWLLSPVPRLGMISMLSLTQAWSELLSSMVVLLPLSGSTLMGEDQAMVTCGRLAVTG